MDFSKKIEIFEVRGPGSHLKPLSSVINLGMYIAIWSSCILIIATCWHRSWFWGNIHRCTMDFYNIVDISEVRGPGSHPKPLSIIIKLGICIDIWPGCIVIIATRWHKSLFWGSRLKYIDVQWISIRK